MNNSSGTMTGTLILSLIVLVIIFLVCREVFCWYWKINKTISLLTEIRDQLAKGGAHTPGVAHHPVGAGPGSAGPPQLPKGGPPLGDTRRSGSESAAHEGPAMTPLSPSDTLGGLTAPDWRARIANMDSFRSTLVKARDNPRMPIDERVSLLEQLGGTFKWDAGSICTAIVDGKEHKFSNGKEFGDWMVQSVIPDALAKVGGPPIEEAAVGRPGTCPNCSASVHMTAAACPECKVAFGAGGRWQVQSF